MEGLKYLINEVVSSPRVGGSLQRLFDLNVLCLLLSLKDDLDEVVKSCVLHEEVNILLTSRMSAILLASLSEVSGE